MKRKTRIFLLFLCVLTAGCGGQKGSSEKESRQEEVTRPLAEEVRMEVEETEEEAAKGEADYDLTAMSSDMVYATVYQMLMDSDAYLGKTIRMEGLYYANYYEPTGQYYHSCIIQDAMACCAQGMEFVWEDGSHVYPEEYPEDGEKITVQGVFEVYQEEGDENLYCRLGEASLERERD